MIQQPLFAPDTAAETDQFAVTADHPVADGVCFNEILLYGLVTKVKEFYRLI
jgi:hypothetical protein